MRSLNFTFQIILIFVLLKQICLAEKYKPIWESLDTRPLPDWYDKAKFGIIFNWGVYSAASYGKRNIFLEMGV